MVDLIALPVTRPAPVRPRYDLTEELRWGRYFLCERVACGGDDECFVATTTGIAGFERYLFLRRFSLDRLDPAMVDRLKRIAMVNCTGVEQIFELGSEAGQAFLVSELIEGIALDQLDARLRASDRRLPWEVALALLFDAADRISQLRAAGALHGGATAARLRFAHTGTLYLCHGAPPPDTTWTRALFAVVRPILRLAATADERDMLDGVLDDPDTSEALAVASDALVVRHPELDPVMPTVVRALLEDAPPAKARSRAMLAERLDATAVRQLWAIVRDPA